MTQNKLDQTSMDLIASMLPDLDANGPGLAMGLWQEGQAPRFTCYGSSRRHGSEISPQTIFDLASVSKMFTALACLICARRFEMDLDTKLAALLPEMHTAAPQVRLRHLLYHTSGLPDYMDLFEADGLDTNVRLGMAETLRLLAAQAPGEAPGLNHQYSNTGYVLLAAVVERLAGLRFSEFVKNHIFEPLGMLSTQVVDRMPANLPKLAHAYIDNAEQEDKPLWEMVGDGQVHSCLTDLGLWIRELLHPQYFTDELNTLLQPGRRMMTLC